MKKVLLAVIAMFVLILASCAASSDGGDENIALIAVGVTFVLAVILIPTLSVTRKMRFSYTRNKHLNDYDSTANKDASFEEKLKSAKLNPQKVIIFGTNRLAIDNVKKKVFVRSSKAIDGVLLGFEDIASYELIKDGKVIAAPGCVTANISASEGEDGVLCSDLWLVIKTKKPSDPEVILPFIAFSIDSEFAYNEALRKAKEAAEALSGIIA